MTDDENYEQSALRSLSSEKYKIVSDAAEWAENNNATAHERKVLRAFSDIFSGDLHDLISDIQRIDDQRLKESILHHLHIAMTSVHTLGRLGAKHNFDDMRKAVAVKESMIKQAAKARDARANSPDAKALIEAIKAERGDGPVAKPTKEAAAILDGVNGRLEQQGLEPVKVDVVRRRLEKFPRS